MGSRVELFEQIRRDHDREGFSIRELACRHGVHRRTELVELRRRVRDLERTLGRKAYELEILGHGFRTWE